MKKQALFLAIFTLFLLLSETDLSNDLLFFFLVGAIPGTTDSLSSTTMLTLIASITLYVIVRLARANNLHTIAAKHTTKTHQLIRAALAKFPLNQA